MRRTDYHTLINRGRKAGLGTGDLYNAIAARPPARADSETRGSDSNGFVADINQQGQRVYRPSQGHTRF